MKQKRRMDLNDKIRNRLLRRGFSNKMLLNSRGLIGAVIEDTILEVTFQNLKDHINRAHEINPKTDSSS